ncbi:MAG: carboxypeptidase regulatory-like domain-containing protein, partial [Planctomycetaceae bacterium]|nr:carboxypeptidase regulatory-like domain-containing protein [Planctomycetaceae bacterium]
GDDSLDSDLDESSPENLELQMTELEAGEVDLSHDLGLVQKTAELGDRIWLDTNGDGLQSDGELGAPGIEVILLNGEREVVARTVTDADGRYRFGDLPPGKYTVDINEATIPEGFMATRTDAGDDSLDSDLDESSPENLELQMTELEAGEVDLSHDLGLVQKPPEQQMPDASVFDGIRSANDLLDDSIVFDDLESASGLMTSDFILDPSQFLDGFAPPNLFPEIGDITPTIPIPQFGGVGGGSINLFGVDLPTAGLPINFALPDPAPAPAPSPQPAPAPEPDPHPQPADDCPPPEQTADCEPYYSSGDDCVTYQQDCEPVERRYYEDC